MPSPSPLSPLFEEFPPTGTDAWLEKISADLGTASVEEALRWSDEGVEMPAFLRRDDLSKVAHVDLNEERSPLASDEEAAPNGWRIRQNISHPDPEEARRLAAKALEGGATDVGLIPASANERGIDLQKLNALDPLLDGLPLNDAGIHLDGGIAAPVLLAALPDDARAAVQTVGFDPVAALARGSGAAAGEAFDLAADLARTAPGHVRTVAVDARVYHDAGGSAVQELAYTLGVLSEQITQLMDRGVSLSTLSSRLHVLLSVSPQYFVDLAKLRAVRLLVPQVLSAFAEEAETTPQISPDALYVQAETSRRSETAYDPHVNMLRTTTEAMAAVLGGCDVLSVRPYDDALRSATDFSDRIARNTQLILEEESHLDVVTDPSAGSYYIEALTDRLAKAAWEEFQALEATGGLLAELKSGRVQSALREKRDERREAANTRDTVLVGTNHYPYLEETRLDDLHEDDGDAIPSEEDGEPTPTSLDALRSALQSAPSISDVVARLRHSPEDIAPLPSFRLSRDLEQLRLRTEKHARTHGGAPVAVLAPIGPAGPRSARATFARNFLGVAGFEVVENLRFDSPDAAAKNAAEKDAEIVVLCSSNEEYATLAPALRSALDAMGHTALMIIAGNPEALAPDLPADAFIHRGSPLLNTLADLQARLGITDDA